MAKVTKVTKMAKVTNKGEKWKQPRTFSQFKREEKRALAIERLEIAEARMEKVQKARP